MIFVTEIGTGRGGAASLDAIRRGDLVQITLGASLQATAIRASYRQLRGRLEGISARLISLADGKTLRLADDALFLLDNREVPRQTLQPGMEATLRVHPKTFEVWEVRARAVARPGS